ncbi:MAG: Crp/Fnr family transcriptional regulator [Leptolyngbyaceae bacterium]|nr:Crp/Fnr family transcriptional regulator [Leptolyngbyaceae bacterium]
MWLEKLEGKFMTRLTFSSLPADLQKAAQRRKLYSNQILFQQNETADSIFFLQSGQIRLVSFINDQVVNNFFVGLGESFAEIAPFFETYPYTAIADQHSEVMATPKDRFIAELNNNPDLCHQVMQQLAQRLDKTQKILTLRSIRSARERVLQYILMQLQPDETYVDLERPLKDIASELGLAPEVLSRTLTTLENDGVINRNKKRITYQPSN